MDVIQSNMKKLSDLFAGPKTSFQVISDLHLDHESQYLTFHIPVAAPFLILAGNIGRLADYDDYLSFIIRRVNLHEKVFLVLGALEFYGIGWMEGLQLAHKMEQDPVTKGRLEVLYETRSELAGTNITLLGCTLWSKIPDVDVAPVLKKMPEFQEEVGIHDWSIEKHNSEHRRDHRWLLEELKTPKPVAPLPATGLAPQASTAPGAGPAASTSSAASASPASAALPGPAAAGQPSIERQIIVITSFAPLKEALDPWQVDAPWATALATDVLSKGNWSSVKMWITGTTGRTCEFEKNGVTIVSNQRGRKGEEVTGLLQDGMSEKQKAGLFDVMKVVKI